jgi:hypothetical protein
MFMAVNRPSLFVGMIGRRHQAGKVPNTWDAPEFIQFIAAMIKANGFDFRELVVCSSVVRVAACCGISTHARIAPALGATQFARASLLHAPLGKVFAVQVDDS